MPSFSTLAAGAWASIEDCQDVHGRIVDDLDEDEAKLTRAITTATGFAQSKMRVRYPTDYPFSSPPVEVRRNVAVIATHDALLSVAAAKGLQGLMAALYEEKKIAVKWFTDIASGAVQLTQDAPSDGYGLSRPAFVTPPGGEFGFGDH